MTDTDVLFDSWISKTGFVMMIAMLLIGPAHAQTNDELNAGIQLNFAPPGARSLAMGGAFVGRADDATAAIANPAGLLWIEKPEVSIEARAWDYTTEYVNGGSYNGTPTGLGLDDGSRPLLDEFDSDTEGLSYLSYVHASEKGRWALSFYHHQAINFTASVDQSQGVFLGTPPDRRRVDAVDGNLELEVANTGIALAYKLRSKFWLGAGLAHSQYEFRSIVRRYNTRVDALGNASFSTDVFSEELRILTRRQDGDGDDLVFNIGALGQVGSWYLGASFRQGGSFEFNVDTEPGGTMQDLSGIMVEGPVRFDIPDILSLGASTSPSIRAKKRSQAGKSIDPLTLSLQVDWVEYSALEPKVNVDGRVIPGAFPFGTTLDDFEIDDGIEAHVGAEYRIGLVTGATQDSRIVRAVRLRAGLWFEPDHTMTYIGSDPFLQARFQPGDDQLHVAAGAGIALRNGLKIDLALDLSERSNVLSLSGVFTFGQNGRR